MPQKERVVVCGAGFAGIKVAKQLEGKADVTLVAPTDRFVYLPLIHEVLSDTVLPKDVTKEIGSILKKANHVHGRAVKVEGKELVTAADERIPFDKLVVAIGAEPNDFGVPGVKDHALSFYSVGDALQANAILRMKASMKPEGEPLRIVVVGASFTGCEVAGEAAELLDKLGVEREIILLDALPKIFPRNSTEFRIGVEEGLDRLDLEVRTGQKIVEVRENEVVVDGDNGPTAIPSDVTFWCAGVKPRFLDGVNAEPRETLQSISRDDVFLVGDYPNFPREKGVPKLAQTAEEQAPLAAHNILNPRKMKHYSPNIKGLIISLGHGYAVAEIAGGYVYKGKVPWHVKRTLYKAKIALV